MFSIRNCVKWIPHTVCKLFCLDRADPHNRSRAICRGDRANIRVFREERREILVPLPGGAEVDNDPAVEKTFKVNIVKIHFLPAIRFYSFPCSRILLPLLPSSSSSSSVARFCFFLLARSRLCTLEYNNPGMKVLVFASIRVARRVKGGEKCR